MKASILVYTPGTTEEGALRQELGPFIRDLSQVTATRVDLCFGSEQAIFKARQLGFGVLSLDEARLRLQGGPVFVVNLVLASGQSSRLLQEALNYVGGEASGFLVEITPPLLEGPDLRDLIIRHMVQGNPGTQPTLLVAHGQKNKALDRVASYKTFSDLFKCKLQTRYGQGVTFIDLACQPPYPLPLGVKSLYIEPLFLVGGYHLRQDIYDGDQAISKLLHKSNIQVEGRRQGLLGMEGLRGELVSQYAVLFTKFLQGQQE